MSNNDNDKDKVIHEYDGIKESDNDLPRWWVTIFYLCVAFAAGYWFYYHTGVTGAMGLQEQFDDYEKARQYAEALSSPPKPPLTEAALKAGFADPAIREKGKAIFAVRCVACHMPDGGGGIGPNLTDDYWLHGGKLIQIATTVTNGVPEKGMISWGPILPQDEILAVVTYVKSLHGTKPANPKAPQGVKEEYSE